MQANIIWKSGMLFDATSHSAHTMLIDGDEAHTQGPSPMEIVLMGLCGCTAIDIVSILNKKREPFTGLSVSAVAEQAGEPPRVFTKVRLIYRVSGKVAAKSMEHAVRLSEDKYCSVAGMISKTAKIEYVIEYVN